ncbi:hypothetical protein KIPB_008844, partial [Kipferlia bialata]
SDMDGGVNTGLPKLSQFGSEVFDDLELGEQALLALAKLGTLSRAVFTKRGALAVSDTSFAEDMTPLTDPSAQTRHSLPCATLQLRPVLSLNIPLTAMLMGCCTWLSHQSLPRGLVYSTHSYDLDSRHARRAMSKRTVAGERKGIKDMHVCTERTKEQGPRGNGLYYDRASERSICLASVLGMVRTCLGFLLPTSTTSREGEEALYHSVSMPTQQEVSASVCASLSPKYRGVCMDHITRPLTGTDRVFIRSTLLLLSLAIVHSDDDTAEECCCDPVSLLDGLVSYLSGACLVAFSDREGDAEHAAPLRVVEVLLHLATDPCVLEGVRTVCAEAVHRLVYRTVSLAMSEYPTAGQSADTQSLSLSLSQGEGETEARGTVGSPIAAAYALHFIVKTLDGILLDPSTPCVTMGVSVLDLVLTSIHTAVQEGVQNGTDISMDTDVETETETATAAVESALLRAVLSRGGLNKSLCITCLSVVQRAPELRLYFSPLTDMPYMPVRLQTVCRIHRLVSKVYTYTPTETEGETEGEGDWASECASFADRVTPLTVSLLRHSSHIARTFGLHCLGLPLPLAVPSCLDDATLNDILTRSDRGEYPALDQSSLSMLLSDVLARPLTDGSPEE